MPFHETFVCPLEGIDGGDVGAFTIMFCHVSKNKKKHMGGKLRWFFMKRKEDGERVPMSKQKGGENRGTKTVLLSSWRH